MVHCRDFIGGNCRHAFNIYKIFWVPCMIVVSKYTPNKITPLIQLRYLKKKKRKNYLPSSEQRVSFLNLHLESFKLKC